MEFTEPNIFVYVCLGAGLLLGLLISYIVLRGLYKLVMWILE